MQTGVTQQHPAAPVQQPARPPQPPRPAGPPSVPASGVPQQPASRSGLGLFGPLSAVLGALAVLFVALAVFFGYQYFSAQNTLANKALVDPAATVEVEQAVSGAVESIFSYDYKDIAKTEQAANDLLVTDEVRGVYNKLLAEVKRNAPKQKIVVTMQVTNAAVVDLGADSARVLVFVDQSYLREGTEDATRAGGQLTVTMQRVDGEWKIADLDAYENRGK